MPNRAVPQTAELRVTMADGRVTAEQVNIDPRLSVADQAADLGERVDNLVHHENSGCVLDPPHAGVVCRT